MLQIKEFINYEDGQEDVVNKWLKEQSDNIDIVDIKYSVGTFPKVPDGAWIGNGEYSGILIIYKVKGCNSHE